jgi:hypothetical protein
MGRQPVPILLNGRFALPAGRYTIELLPRSAGGSGPALVGHLALQAGRSGGSLTDWDVKAGVGERWQATFDLPVDVNFVGFRADPELEARVGELRILPVRVVPTLDRVAAYEVLATMTLGRFVFLFHDGSSYPEPDGFWVRGSNRAIVSVVSRAGHLTTRVRLRLRSPVANTIRFETPGLTWTEDLQPGVPKDIEVEPTALDGTLRMIISPARGFRPSDVTPGSQDRRFLGCWVEVVE